MREKKGENGRPPSLEDSLDKTCESILMKRSTSAFQAIDQ